MSVRYIPHGSPSSNSTAIAKISNIQEKKSSHISDSFRWPTSSLSGRQGKSLHFFLRQHDNAFAKPLAGDLAEADHPADVPSGHAQDGRRLGCGNRVFGHHATILSDSGRQVKRCVSGKDIVPLPGRLLHGITQLVAPAERRRFRVAALALAKSAPVL